MAKLTIDNSELAEEFLSGSRLLGIQCPADAHRFVWMVNRHCLYDFRYEQEHEIVLGAKRRRFRFPVYRCREAQLDLEHILYTNEHDGEYLLPELRHLDYLWLLKGEAASGTLPGLLVQDLRRLDGVQLVVELTPDKIRHKEHLIL